MAAGGNVYYNSIIIVKISLPFSHFHLFIQRHSPCIFHRYQASINVEGCLQIEVTDTA